MQQFPLFITLTARTVLVVGGGPIAARKVRALIPTGAHIEVVSPTLCAELIALKNSGDLTHRATLYKAGDARQYWLSIAATNDVSVNALVASDAMSADALVNVTDNPELGNVSFASIVNRNPLQIAISTGGSSPILARLIRSRIAAFIPSVFTQSQNGDGFGKRH